MDRWVCEWTCGYTWMSGQNGWVDEWTDGRLDGYITQLKSTTSVA